MCNMYKNISIIFKHKINAIKRLYKTNMSRPATLPPQVTSRLRNQ